MQGSMRLYSQARGTLQKAVKAGAAHPEMRMALGILHKYYVEDKKAAENNFRNYLSHDSIKYRAAAQLELRELLGE